MGVQGVNNDPLEDLLKNLPDWPGNRKPKNRPSSNAPFAEDRFNGAKPRKFLINGVEVQMFTVGGLAQALGKKATTIRAWEHRGWIPKAQYRTPKPRGPQIPEKTSRGRRLYTLEQVEFLLEAAERFNIDDKNNNDWNGFREYIKQNWPK